MSAIPENTVLLWLEFLVVVVLVERLDHVETDVGSVVLLVSTQEDGVLPLTLQAGGLVLL